MVGVADVDEELVDKAQLTAWLALGGRRIGLGDWRPEKSGFYGRFDVEDVTELTAAAAVKPSRRGPRPSSDGKRGRARRERGGPTGPGLPPSDAGVARSDCRGPCRGVAWHGGTGPRMARRGLARQGRFVPCELVETRVGFGSLGSGSSAPGGDGGPFTDSS